MRGLIALVPLVAGCDVLFQVRHVEPGPAEPPSVVANGNGNCTDCSTKTVSFTAVAGRPSTMLLVSVAVSEAGGAPAIASVTYGGMPLSFVLRGTAESSTNHPGLESWLLVEPPPGAAPLTVTLGANAMSLVFGITQVEGTNAVDPVRATKAAGSTALGKDADNAVDSDDLDLVIDAVCAGSSVDTPAQGQTVLYVENLSDAFTCGNLASSVSQGAAPSVPVHWSVNGAYADHWIDLAASIAP